MAELSDEMILAAQQKAVEGLEAGNQRSYDEIREFTNNQFTMDTSDLRREMMWEALQRAGIVTPEMALEMELRFQKKVEEELNSAWVKVREIKAKAQKPKLFVPGGGVRG